jgi:hypothetical protein
VHEKEGEGGPVEKEEEGGPVGARHGIFRWKTGDAILGHFTVKVCSATGLVNPSRGVNDSATAHNNRNVRNAGLISFCYFAIGAIVFQGNCVTELGGERAWTFVDTVYFGVVTITTTGYGDLLPNHNYCNNFTIVFTCIYTFVGVGLIAAALGFMVSILLESKAEGGISNHTVLARTPSTCGEHILLLVQNFTTTCNPVYHLSKLAYKSMQPSVKAFSYWAILKCIVIIYFTHADPRPDEPAGVECTASSFSGGVIVIEDSMVFVPDCDALLLLNDTILSPNGVLCDVNNNSPNCSNYCADPSHPLCIDSVQNSFLSPIDAVYMTSVSLTSVGYGDFSASSQPARAFTIFWLLFGTLLTAKAWGALAQSFLKHMQDKLNRKNLHVTFDAKSVMKLDDDASGEVNQLEFIAHMLVKTHVVDQAMLMDIRKKFKELDESGDGFITAEDLIAAEARQASQLEREAKLAQDLELTMVVPIRKGSVFS